MPVLVPEKPGTLPEADEVPEDEVDESEEELEELSLELSLFGEDEEEELPELFVEEDLVEEEVFEETFAFLDTVELPELDLVLSETVFVFEEPAEHALFLLE